MEVAFDYTVSGYNISTAATSLSLGSLAEIMSAPVSALVKTFLRQFLGGTNCKS
jgi:hypothetical protein